MITVLMSLAAVTGAANTDDQLATAEQAQARALALRCDAAGYQAAVGRVEDQALAAMKAANEAVAKAARAGPVGEAGDADWARYKALMSQAEQMRWENAAALAACRTTEPASAAPAPVRPAPPETAAAKPEDLAAAAPPPRDPTRHFRISLENDHETIRTKAQAALPIYQQTGVVNQVATIPHGSPPPSPPPPFAPSSPYGYYEIAGPDRMMTGQVPLSSKAQETSDDLKLSYAENGFDASGLRLAIGFAYTQGNVEQFLAKPTPGSLTVGQGVLQITYPYGNLDVYSYNYPYTETVYGVPETLYGRFLAQVDVLNSSVRYRKFGLSLDFGRTSAVDSPVGELLVTPGLRLKGDWWAVNQVMTLTGGLSLQPLNVTTATFANVGSGPGFEASGTLEVQGRIRPAWPVKWSLAGDFGAEGIDVSFNGASRNLARVGLIGDLGARVEYDFLPGWGVELGILEKRIHYISDDALTLGPVDHSVSAEGAQFFNFPHAWATSYTATLHYDF